MNYRIGGITFSLEAVHTSTHTLLAAYRTEERPEAVISVTEADIRAERERQEGETASDGYLESLAVLRRLSDILLEKNTLLFHGSAVAVEEEAYIFTAPSGTGKSTHARLWRELLGRRAVMINDDKPFIRVGDPCLVYGSPWDGKHHLSHNAVFPLRAICFLSRAGDNSIDKTPAAQAIPRLLNQAYRAEAVDRILPLVLKLAEAMPMYELRCNMEPEAAALSWETLSHAGTPRGKTADNE